MQRLGTLLLLCPLAALAQTPPAAETRVMETLLAEVQQLRLAIERSTLLAARTQLAITQLQLQEARWTQIAQQHAASRETLAGITDRKNKLVTWIREMETSSSPRTPSGEIDLKQFKDELEHVTGNERKLTARESELAGQAMAAQREVQDSRNWIAEMQRTLDTAIQQMVRPR